MNYPKRGCLSEDGKYYTHTDGTVWLYLGQPTPNRGKCVVCKWRARGTKCGAERPSGCNYRQVAGAYVLSDEEQSACDMARKQIYRCAYMARLVNCKNCEFFKAKKCDARLFLAAHQQPDAWEVKP